jgi:hypothetical protein
MSHQTTFLTCPSRLTRRYTSTTLEPCASKLADIHKTKTSKTQKHKSHQKLIFTSTRSSVHFPITCYNLLTNQWRSDSRGVTDIQYRYVCILHISPSLITVARVHSTLHPCFSNQCNTARLESKLTSIQIMHISSHEIVHSFSYDAQRPLYQNPQRRYDAVRLRNEERPSVFVGTLPVFRTSRSLSFPTPLTILKITHFSATHLFQLYCTYLHIMMRFDHDKFLPLVVKLSTTLYCTYISCSQYNGTHYNDSTQYGNQHTSTDCT